MVLGMLGETPDKLALALGVMLAASTLYFSIDLRSGDPSTYPKYFDALIDGFYQAMITMTTVGYGDLTLTTNVGKIMSPVGLPLLTNAFANFAEATAGPADPSEKKTWADLKMFKCPAVGTARTRR